MRGLIAVMAGMAVAGWAGVAGAADKATYDEQIREMGYGIIHISSLNVINGLNLSREQIVQLRELAAEVERAGEGIPAAKGEMPGELAEVRKAYQELEKVLLAGEQVSDELERRVRRARATESKWIRESVAEKPGPQDTGMCQRCHLSPERVAQIRKNNPTGTENAALKGQGLYANPKQRRDTAMAHMEGVLGKKGLAKAAQLGPKVDAILTDGQKEVMGQFSCCLVPPKNLSDPERVGQAEVTDRKIETLRAVRKAPAGTWPEAKEKLISRMAESMTMRRTGASEDTLAEYKTQLGDLFEKVRKLSDTEFEMKKDELCTEMDLRNTQGKIGQRDKAFKESYFLLTPGSVKAYDNLLARMAKQGK